MKKIAGGLLNLAITLLVVISTYAQTAQQQSSQPSPSPPTFTELENIRLQKERLEFDRQKAKTDGERKDKTIKVEESKVLWSAIATAVPLALGVIAIVVGFWNQHQQAKHQFKLKAAEIIFEGTTPQAIFSRSRALKAIFKKQLSKDFLLDLTPEDIGDYKEPSEERRLFLDQLLKYPEKKAEIVKLWFVLFPGDYRWLVRVDPEQFKDIDLPEIKELLAEVPQKAIAVQHSDEEKKQPTA